MNKSGYLLGIWTARIWGALVIVFILTFVLGSLMGESEMGEGIQSYSDGMQFICFPFGLTLGLILAFKWPFQGGAIATVSMLLLFFLRADLLSNLLFVLVFLPPSVLYLVMGYIARRNRLDD